MAGSDAVVHLDRLRKVYGDSVAVDDVSLTIERGELVCLLGPSGCGKTTTLKMIAGFTPPTAGRIAIAGLDVTHMPPQRRDTGMVFQNYALFPHLSVAENIGFGPRNVGMSRAAIKDRVTEMLDLVQMRDFAARLPSELSGGQQQRVALARALALRPAVLLLDEPLSNLDAKLRLQMREEIRGLVKKLHITTVLVTHDQEEALAIADRMVVMNRGRIEQIGRPIDVYESPETLFVAEFIGTCNLLPVQPAGEGTAIIGATTRIPLPVSRAWTQGVLAIRPEHLRIVAPDRPGIITGRVARVVFMGSAAHVRLEVDGVELIAETPSRQARGLAAGQVVGMELDPRYLRLFD
jgi:putative spermidine/putrescine transport system ATP-binding protein